MSMRWIRRNSAEAESKRDELLHYRWIVIAKINEKKRERHEIELYVYNGRAY